MTSVLNKAQECHALPHSLALSVAFLYETNISGKKYSELLEIKERRRMSEKTVFQTLNGIII
jgi:hypothetical protein